MTKEEKIKESVEEFYAGKYMTLQAWTAAKRKLIWNLWKAVSLEMERTKAYYEVARLSNSSYSMVVEVVKGCEKEQTAS